MKNKPNIEKILENIVFFLIIIKLIFLVSTVGDIIIKYFKDDTTRAVLLDKKFLYWKQVTEFIFVVSMALLLIFIFDPWYKNQIYITREMSIMFYLYGFIILITANWGTIITEPGWFKRIKSALTFNSK